MRERKLALVLLPFFFVFDNGLLHGALRWTVLRSF